MSILLIRIHAMEALGVASSIAGLISLTEVIVFKTSKYCLLVKGARSDIRDLLAEVQSLYGVLSRLKLLATCLEDDEPYYAKSKNIPRLDHFQTCRQNLDLLKKSLGQMDLDNAKGWAAAKIKLLWPFKVDETKELLEKIGRNKRDLSEALMAEGIASLVNALSTTQSRLAEDIANVQRELQRAADEKAENEMDEHKRKVFDWCSTADPYQKHRNSKELRHPNTLSWLFDSPEYMKWTEEANSALWLYGIPGAGKTILSSAVIEEAKILAHQRPRHAIAYYYCEHRLKETQQLSNILGSMIKQLCAGSDDAYDELDAFYTKYHEKSNHLVPASSEDLGKLLKRLSRHFECVMIVVDGLDECALPEERNLMLELFSTLHAPDQGNIRAVYASRDEIDIREKFSRLEAISIEARGNDLELFVAAGIELRISNNSLRLNDTSLKEVIIDGIVSKARGMFQWAKCQLDHLCLLTTDRERRKALDSLPKDLFETYKRILDRVNNASESTKSLVEKTLRWLCFSSEPLTIESLTTLLAIKINSKVLHPDDIPDEYSVLYWCSSLVSKDKDGTVSLTHFTVKEFLMDKKLLEIPDLRRYCMQESPSNAIFAKIFITYLHFVRFSKWSLEIDRDEADEILQKHPVLGLACKRWPIASSGHDSDDELFDLTCRLLHPRKTHTFLLWLTLQFRKFVNARRGIPKSAPTLNFAATFGLTRVCEWLIKRGADVNFNNTYFGTPLICSIRGMTNWTDWEESNLDGWSNDEGMPNPDTVRVLLESGALKSASTTINKPMYRHEKELVKVTPMALALDLIYSHKELGCRIFKELLDADAISSFANSSFWTRCERLGSDRLGLDWRQDLVELFTETLEHSSAKSIDAESREKMMLFVTSYGKPLDGGELENLQIGAGDVFKSDHSVEQLVKSAAENGQKHLLEGLIAKGVDPDILSQGLAPAASAGFTDIVGLLLESFPPEKRSESTAVKDGWTNAALEGKVECLELFLKHGVDVNMPVKHEYIYEDFPNDPSDAQVRFNTKYHETALACAIYNGALEAVKFLSENPEIDFGAKTEGLNFLHLAVQAPSNRTEMVQLLLGKGVDPLEVSDDKRSLLHHLLSNPFLVAKDFDLLKSFIELGCKVDAIDQAGNTMLHILVADYFPTGYYQGREVDDFDYDHIYNMIRYMFEIYDMRPVVRDDGLLPLQIAVRRRLPSRVIKTVIPEEPSCWNCVGPSDRSSLHEVVEPGSGFHRFFDDDASLRILEVLLSEPDVEVNVVDSKGRTPFLLISDLCFKGSPTTKSIIIKELLKAGANVNAAGVNQWTAAHCLASSGYVRGLAEVLEYSPNLRVLNDRGHSPFHCAVERGQMEAVRLFLERCSGPTKGEDDTKIDLGQKSSDGYLPIHMASIIGADEILQLLHDTGSVLDINAISGTGSKLTALHYAVEANYASTVQYLLELGADINARDDFKTTPLHLAAEMGFKDMAMLLVEHGADVAAEDSSGCQPWLTAAVKGHEELKDALYELTRAEAAKRNQIPKEGNLYLKKRPTMETDQLRTGALVSALERNDLSVCRALLESGKKPDMPLDQFKRTALHIASGIHPVLRKDAPQMTSVELLLEFGANTSIKDVYGNTPLHTAALADNHAIIESLYNNGADLEARNDDLQTPLHLAAKEGYINVVRTLLILHSLKDMTSRYELDGLSHHEETSKPPGDKWKGVWLKRDEARHLKFIGSLDFERKTPLMMAMEGRSMDVVAFLLEEGADLAVKDVFLRDTFWQAGYCNNKTIIRNLLERKADVNVTDYFGFTCLHNVASKHPKRSERAVVLAIARMLLEAGAKLHSDNLVKASPLHCACSYGNGGLVKMFLRVLPKEEIDIESPWFGTPLYAAAFRGWRGTTRLMLKAGANTEIGFAGETPLQAAKNGGHKQVVELLEQYVASEKRRLNPSNRLIEWRPSNYDVETERDENIPTLGQLQFGISVQSLQNFDNNSPESRVFHPLLPKSSLDSIGMSLETIKKLEDNPTLFHLFSPLVYN